MTTPQPVAVVGGGIGGLSVALALGRVGAHTTVYEQSPQFEELGAGIGLGPNAVRRLDAWGLGQSLREIACIPDALLVRDAEDGRVLGRLPMADAFVSRHGAQYLTVHRADLHQLLLKSLQRQGTAALKLNHGLSALTQAPTGVQLTFDNGEQVDSVQALIGADGLHSRVRGVVCGEQAPVPSGHWAYRTLLPMQAVPLAWRQSQMGMWLGSGLHVVHYPVRGGESLNLVVLVEAKDDATTAGWDVARTAAQTDEDLQAATHACCPALQALLEASAHWRAWCLFDRPPVPSAAHLVRGSVALAGDAAHPMLPYLAQGAGMAIEDADCLAHQWQIPHASTAQRLQMYAQARWQRVAKVQQRARRNGRIFHADGGWRMARNLAMALGGAKLMDMPWLYGA